MTPRILAVSDAPDVLALLQVILAAEGFAVQRAGSLDGARAALADLPDLVIGDVRLAGGAPFALLSLAPAPVLLLSGDLRTDQQTPLRPGVALVPKPFELERLLDEVRRLLAGAW